MTYYSYIKYFDRILQLNVIYPYLETNLVTVNLFEYNITTHFMFDITGTEPLNINLQVVQRGITFKRVVN